jgi:hypothetical protein
MYKQICMSVFMYIYDELRYYSASQGKYQTYLTSWRKCFRKNIAKIRKYKAQLSTLFLLEPFFDALSLSLYIYIHIYTYIYIFFKKYK